MGTHPGRRPLLLPILFGFLALLAFGILYFFQLGGFPLLDPDEPVYGIVARGMANGAGWLSPHFFNDLWFDKPPLFYWLSGFTSVIFGVTELAARLPSAILAVGLVLLVYALAAYDFGKRAGLLSAVVMATCLQQIVLAHAAVTDMTLVFCLTASLYAFRRWLDVQGRAAYGWASLCAVMAGLGMLAKGPVAPLLLSLTIVIYLIWSKRLVKLKSGDALWALVATLLVGLPWFIAMYRIHPVEFVQVFLQANNLSRFTQAEHAAQTGGWYSYLLNIPILFAFLLPWSAFLPQAIKQRFWRQHEGARLAFVWVLVVFVFFSLSKTILVTYIFPLFPAAALLIGALWNAAADAEPRAIRGVRNGLIAGVSVAVLITVFLVYYAQKEYPGTAPAAWILGGILCLASVTALIWSYKRAMIIGAAWIVAGGMVCFTFWLMTGIIPVVARQLSQRDIVKALPNIPQGRIIGYYLPTNDHASLYYYGTARAGYDVSYLGPKVGPLGKKEVVTPAEEAREREALLRLLAEPVPTFVIGRDRKEFKALVEKLQLRTWNHTGDYLIIANTAALTRKGSPDQ